MITFKLENLPRNRPPPTDVRRNLKDCPKTALLNASRATARNVRFETKNISESEMVHAWFCICYVDDVELGRAYSKKKKAAEDEAAKMTIEGLEEKKDPMLRTGRSYLPVFQEFIRNNQLEERVSICTEAHGPPHHPTWRCIIKLDDIKIASGEGAPGETKKVSMEKAAINASDNWPEADFVYIHT